MSATRLKRAIYSGAEGFVVDSDRYVNFTIAASTAPSLFYLVMRILSAALAFAFIVLLVLSLVTGGPIHWAVSVIGCLGSIGLAGAIWLSKAYMKTSRYG